MLQGHTLDNIFGLADFDRTISQGTPQSETSFNVFGSAPGAHPDMFARRTELFAKYRPIEIDASLSPEIKLQHMQDWHHAAMEVLAQYIDETRLQEVIHHATQHIRIREGVKDFFDFLSGNKVPIIIFSAGVSNVIEGVLNHHKIPYDAVHGNRLGFIDGVCRPINDGVFIGQKNWLSIPSDIRDIAKGRTHSLLLGDSLGDLDMRDSERVTTSIGFLLSEHKRDIALYQKSFTHVVESDTGDNGFFARIIEELKKQS